MDRGDATLDAFYPPYQDKLDKLMKEIGFSTLVAMIGGSQGAEALGQLVQVLSSTAYSRTLEREADETAVHYLMKAGMNPRGLAEFLHNLPQETNLPGFTEWISTHPDSEERYKVINEIVEIGRASCRERV